MDFEKLKGIMDYAVNEMDKKQKDMYKSLNKELAAKARGASDEMLMRNLEKYQEEGKYDFAEVVEKEARRRGLI